MNLLPSAACTLSLLVAACAAPVHYTAPAGASPAVQQRELQACRDDAALLRYPGDRETLVQQCMSQKGYGVEG